MNSQRIRNILVTNDDGYEAKGIRILHGVARELFPDARITVIAPRVGVSGASRSLTFGVNLYGGKKLVRTDPFEQEGMSGVMVSGTPGDCVEIALRHSLRKGNATECDLVLSGVNHGWNLAQDIPLSGTFGAAAHAWEYFGVPAVALSAPKTLFESEWAATWVQAFLRTFVNREAWNSTGVININFPKSALPSKIPWEVIEPGEYRAMGPLTDMGPWLVELGCGRYQEVEGTSTFDLLEPMGQLSCGGGDYACVTNGRAAITRHFGAEVHM